MGFQLISSFPPQAPSTRFPSLQQFPVGTAVKVFALTITSLPNGVLSTPQLCIPPKAMDLSL